MARLSDTAPAKVNLTLRVLGRRADGRHELASLVAFASVGDRLMLDADTEPGLVLDGPAAAMAGPVADNLVLTAACALGERVEGMRLGRFLLTKILPAGAGLGGGSADAAAAMRLLAQANRLAGDDPRILEAATATGADVAVCLDPRARLMHGGGEIFSPPLALPPLDAVLVFPGTPLATASVFRRFDMAAGTRRRQPYAESEIPRGREALLQFLLSEPNDLEPAAQSLTPLIAAAREALEGTAPRLVRMTGSGSAVFALYDDASAARSAAARVGGARSDWWVKIAALA